MAKVKKYSGNGESIKSVWNDSGDKRYGFVSKDRVSDYSPKTRYGAGIDNLPLSGYHEGSVDTPLGTFDFGNDQDTAFAGFTPNVYAGRYSDPQQATNWAGIGDWEVRANRWGNNGNPMYTAALNMPDNVNIPDVYKSAVTPIGSFEFGTNDGNPGIWADYQPQNNANYYLQALANLINRGR